MLRPLPLLKDYTHVSRRGHRWPPPAEAPIPFSETRWTYNSTQKITLRWGFCAVVFIFNQMLRCSHSIWSFPSSSSSSTCCFPAELRCKKSDCFKTNLTSHLADSTYRLPILSSRSLSSLRLKRSWFLFSCFSATVF